MKRDRLFPVWLLWLLLPLLVHITSCSLLPLNSKQGNTTTGQALTLADLQPAVMPSPHEALPEVDIETLAATYREVLEVTDDPALRLRVLHRLAGLEMGRSEQTLYEQNTPELNTIDQQTTVENHFALAITAYQSLLNQHPGHEKSDQWLYQLSKAYDLAGASDQSMKILDQLVAQHSDSPYYAEAQFRRAERFFTQRDYHRAGQAYEAVIQQGSDTPLYANALYMQGWSRFKLEDYQTSLKSFTQVLDLYVPGNHDLSGLSSGQGELIQDSLRIMSVIFSYLDGPQTITKVYQDSETRHYMPLLYERLGKLYLEKKRFKDGAEAYRAFVERYPQSELAPVFHANLINAYLAGEFVLDVLREKENYIKSYGIDSEYWRQKPQTSRDAVRPLLKQYLPELARHFHARAQETKSVDLYLKAVDYYQAFIDTFPTDGQVPEMLFLLAESCFEAEAYTQAIKAYEQAAYEYPDYHRGASAGYAAMLAHGQLLQGMPQEAANPAHVLNPEYEQRLRLKIASQLKFADAFHTDPREVAVLTQSAKELLALNEYQQAINTASQLIKRDPPASPPLLETAWLVTGHSEFEQQHFDKAQAAYDQALRILPADAASRPDILERLAASAYKQAEHERDAGDLALAAKAFLRVETLAPTSSISMTARLDAANLLLEAAHWTQAIVELKRFRNDYPNHPLSTEIAAKLVLAYQQTGQGSKAADELTVIYNASQDEATRKESLYQAGEWYEKAGDQARAILCYREYAHAYPEPFALAMEARYKLSELYRQTRQPEKRRYWLKEMIEADRSAGQQRTERSRYLAAMSSSVLADDAYQAFTSIELKLPLKNSLKKKKQALNKALAAYRQAADYGVAEFTTLAVYRLGEIYRQLGRDLMDSERPKNLDALALEQYELLLEEQAYPFEEKAIELHETNIQRSWDGIYDDWVKDSFKALKSLLPARYAKEERGIVFSDHVY